MKVGSLHEGLRAMLWTHEAFRKLGFTSDEIVPSVAIDMRTGELTVFVEIVHGGVTEFTYTVVPVWMDPDALIAAWNDACVLWNASSDEDVMAIWGRDGSLEDFEALALALRLKGVRMPAVEATENAHRN